MFEVKYFKKGDLIIEEGKTEEIAYLIQKGNVEVFRTVEGKRIVLSKLGVGSVIGEMSLLTGEARTASVVALEDTGVNAISHEDFEMMLNTNPRSVIPILKEAFRKLINMNQLSAAFHDKGEAPAEPASVDAKQGLRLIAQTAEAQRALQGREIAIAKTPFNIGRSAKDGTFENLDLKLLDSEPYQLSRNHCAIVFVQNKYHLIDTSSTLGTTVDSIRIGKREARKNIPLESGRHSIILGGPHSSYRFEIDVP